MEVTVMASDQPAERESAPDPHALEFEHVSMFFDDSPALQDITFKLQRGQMVFITGAAGSGKSVLLHLAIGLMHPSRGRILVNGRDISGLDETELLAIRSRDMGLVFQEDALFTGMSTYDNAAYRLVEHELPEAEVDRAVREILTFVGLENDLEKLPEELSIGMRRRLELARALAGCPSIMLFDEPTSGLDPINSRQVLDLIIRARDINGGSSLFVTKELHQIPYAAYRRAERKGSGEVTISKVEGKDRPNTGVIVLHEGRIAFTGSVEDFESSQKPEVAELTHPKSTVREEDIEIRDPWSKERHWKL